MLHTILDLGEELAGVVSPFFAIITPVDITADDILVYVQAFNTINRKKKYGHMGVA